MKRFAGIVTAAMLAGGCLDDELDADAHFLRETPSSEESEASEDAAQADAGTVINADESVTLGNLESFIALDRDFESFQTWPNFDLGSGAHAVSQAAPTHVYINALPQKGDREFRVGTIVVKVLELGQDPSTWQVHAMVKRGAAYNSKGAYGWEYFDFTLDDQGVPHQNWRGANVPDGESYQVTVFTADGKAIQEDVPDCNTCHQSADNDAVNTPALELARWQ